MKPTLSALTLLASLSAALLAPALHAAPFTPEQETRIKELIRETLIANPKILDEAAESWEKQNAAAQEAQLGNFIKGNKDVLFNSATSPRLGAKNPKLTLVLFTDYNCPYCKQFDPQLTKLLKAYPDDLGLVIKLLPFKGQTSAKAAQYSLTLWQQDPARFLTLHDKLMSKQGMLTEADINKALRPPATPRSNRPPRRPKSCATACASAPFWGYRAHRRRLSATSWCRAPSPMRSWGSW